MCFILCVISRQCFPWIMRQWILNLREAIYTSSSYFKLKSRMQACGCTWTCINKRIPFRGCDTHPPSPLKYPKPTTECFFKDVNECQFEVQHRGDATAGGKGRNNKLVQAEYQKSLSGHSVVCTKVPEVPVSSEKTKWNHAFTWLSNANPQYLHPALVPQGEPGKVKTEEDVPRLITKRS